MSAFDALTAFCRDSPGGLKSDPNLNTQRPIAVTKADIASVKNNPKLDEKLRAVFISSTNKSDALDKFKKEIKSVAIGDDDEN